MNALAIKKQNLLKLRILAEQRASAGGSNATLDALHLSRELDLQEQELFEAKTFVNYLRLGEERLSDEEKKALSDMSDPAGGYTAPPAIAREVLRQASGISPIREYATIRTLSRGNSYPLPKEKTRPQIRWVRDTDQHSITTEMTYSGESIPVHIADCCVAMSSKLAEDPAMPLTEWFIPSVRDAFTAEDGKQFVTGDGLNKPEGILSHPSIPVVNSGSASTLTGDGVEALFYKVPEPYRSNGRWLANQGTIQIIRQLKDSDGGYLFQAGQGGTPDSILGRPLIECPNMPDVAANAYPLVFGDLSYYWIVDRLDMAILVDPFSSKPNIVYDIVHRVGGQVVEANAFAKQKMST
jgi:HK97 family phage major capsid protein